MAPIGAAFKQTRTLGSAPRVSPKPQRGAGLIFRSIPGGGGHPRLGKGYGRSMPTTTRRAGTSSARRPATEAAGTGVSDRDTAGEGAEVLQGNPVGPDSQPAEETSSGSEYGTGEGEPEAEPEPEAEEEAVGNGDTSADDGQEFLIGPEKYRQRIGAPGSAGYRPGKTRRRRPFVELAIGCDKIDQPPGLIR